MADAKLIFITGFSGSGKSTVGPLLAKRLKIDFIDSDLEIERTEGRSIADIFAKDGRRAFRKMELKVIESIIFGSMKNSVISLGGGALLNKDFRRIVKRNGLVIYLSCSIGELLRRLKNDDDRPLLHQNQSSISREKQKSRIKSLIAMRLTGYKEAHYTLSTTNRTVVTVVRELSRIITKSGFLK